MRWRLASLALLVCLCLADGRAASRGVSAIDLLDRYASGEFDAVVDALAADIDFQDLLKQLRRDGPAWIDAKGPADRARRELVAATFALEAARADEWYEWKWTQKQPPMCGPGGCYQPLNVLYWQPPPLLIEWACELFRRDATPRPIERWWQLAALAVAQRSEDAQFLVGDTKIGLGVNAGEIINLQHEIKHLDHVMKRFPKEMRFVLAQGIARDRDWQDDATQAYGAVGKDPDVGGEAMMRLGAMQMRQRRIGDALRSLERAESLTRDPYVIYLARYFKAQVLERQQRPAEAQAAYRGAAAAVPHAQGATLALAASLFADGRRTEAHGLAGAMLAADPAPPDPWRTFVHADDRFWPQLIGRLRAEIAK